MSYTNLVYHIVFRTYHSIPAIDEEHERELYALLPAIAPDTLLSPTRWSRFP